ncbi:hypothetical protein DENIT_70050 [Pseudomonas veronii]|nr:hypothetical protein DENIT_70050 [Pseudomonas veronii]
MCLYTCLITREDNGFAGPLQMISFDQNPRATAGGEWNT